MSTRMLLTAALALTPALAVPYETCKEPAPPKTVTVTKTEYAAGPTGAPYPTGGNSTAPAPTTTALLNPECPTTIINGSYPVIVATASVADYGLHQAALDAGKEWVGTAADIPGTDSFLDSFYMEAFNNSLDFGQATPANVMKWMFTEPEPGEFDFSGGDFFLDLVEATNKEVTCHNLVWYNQLPEWVTEPAEPWTVETMTEVIVRHVEALVTHFGDRCKHWDVINEAFLDDDEASFRETIFYEVLGEEYIYLAFSTAQGIIERDGLAVKLYYNDYNIENINPKSDASRQLVRDLQERGIQIDGVGLQSHFIGGSAPSQAAQEENMLAFTDLGVQVTITEIDVRVDDPASLPDQIAAIQNYYDTAAACIAVEGCTGITVWDFVDSYSWIPYTFEGEGFGTPWLQPQYVNTPLLTKGAYDGLLNGLTGGERPSYNCAAE